ncbi:hypothetical protein BT96DRAFT_935147 [Gymnopus androsaceus JB14]|uniref:Uncharacterized protein n=1 Tax=Gymnopus androsaceus JB14 TaxID=1447944 RepID=A0A6A4I5J6_9AGAR|nr:hypothetical protein BT96DRAFT_935147 [Gymnopus androsaceus JB14]
MSTAILDMSPPRPAFHNEGKSIKSSKSNPPSLKSFSMKGKISFLSGLLSKSSSRINIHEIPNAKPMPETPPELPEKEKVEERIIVARQVVDAVCNSQLMIIIITVQLTRPRISLRLKAILRVVLMIGFCVQVHLQSDSLLPSANLPKLREAALRERGLLPARDMSALEREQDARISPIFPVPEMSTDGLSAADRIKREWEAKIQSDDSRADGEKSSSPTLEVADQLTAPEPTKPLFLDLGTVHEVATPLPSPSLQSPSLRNSSSRSNLALAKPPPTCDLPPTPVDAEFVPLPPSPFAETSSIRSLEISPRVIPLPPSPSPPSSPRTAESTDSHIFTSKSVETHSNSATPHSKTSLLPSANSYECSEDGALAPPNFTLESSFSHATHKTKPNSLVKTWTNEPKVPVIIESPVEEFGPVIPSLPEVELKDLVPDQNPISSSPPRRRAQTTVEGDTKEKRKSLFGKRTSLANLRQSDIVLPAKTTTFDLSNIPPSPTVPASPAGQSMFSFDVRTECCVERISPERPNSWSLRTGVGPRPVRQALSPTIHTRGSISFETTHIEDDETRRMTEMAFFG